MWRLRNPLIAAIVAVVLCTVLQPNRRGWNKRVAAKVQLNNLEGALGRFREDIGTFPTNEQGLAALRENPDVKGWSGPYLAQDIPLDPWGRPYVYRYPGEHSDEPDIVSWGANGKPGGNGNDADVVSWRPAP